MKPKYTLRQRLIVPFIIFSGLIIVGVRSIYKGLLMQQAWRVVLAATGIVCFTTLLVFLIITVYKQEKAAKALPKD